MRHYWDANDEVAQWLIRDVTLSECQVLGTLRVTNFAPLIDMMSLKDDVEFLLRGGANPELERRIE
jgi:hypothetical protein